MIGYTHTHTHTHTHRHTQTHTHTDPVLCDWTSNTAAHNIYSAVRRWESSEEMRIAHMINTEMDPGRLL